jgi:hypothetical protein
MSAKRITPIPWYACGSRPSRSKPRANPRSDLASLDPVKCRPFGFGRECSLGGVDCRLSCKSERLLGGRETTTTNPRPTKNRCCRRCRQIDGEWPYTQTAQIGQSSNCGFLQRRDYTKLRQHGGTRRGLIVIFYIGASRGSDEFVGAHHIPQITQLKTRARFVPAGSFGRTAPASNPAGTAASIRKVDGS